MRTVWRSPCPVCPWEGREEVEAVGAHSSRRACGAAGQADTDGRWAEGQVGAVASDGPEEAGLTVYALEDAAARPLVWEIPATTGGPCALRGAKAPSGRRPGQYRSGAVPSYPLVEYPRRSLGRTSPRRFRRPVRPVAKTPCAPDWNPVFRAASVSSSTRVSLISLAL